MNQIKLKKHFKNASCWFYEQALCRKQREQPILRQVKENKWSRILSFCLDLTAIKCF